MKIKKGILVLSGVFLLWQAPAQKLMEYRNTIQVEESDSKDAIIAKSAHVIPTANQFAALQNEFIAFIHFGPNTFTRMEWGNGMEDPKVFDLKELDTDQWCEAMKAAGMKMVILTVKHHDGFCLWQTRYTKQGIMSTGFKNGNGDILKELSESCRKYGLKLGIYLSPADLYQIESPDGLYGNLSKHTKRTIPREAGGRPFENKTTFEFVVDDYNEYFLNQLFELLTEYGPIHEVWFDGAHPKRKGDQKYDYQAWRRLIRTLAPGAVIFGREDIRWCGNEGGATRDTERNVIPYQEDPAVMNDFMDLTSRDLSSEDVLLKKQRPYYLHYQPAETNTSIREGWFYRDDARQKVRSTDDVFDIYERAVGGNSIFLLNIPPNRNGKFSDTDVRVLTEAGTRIRETYGTNLLENASGPKELLDHRMETALVLDQQPQEIVITTPAPVTFNRLSLQEAVATNGERVQKHAVDAYIDGEWKEIAQASIIGYKRILRFPEVTTDRIRVRILESRPDPAICTISAHYYKTHPPMLAVKRNREGMVSVEPVRSDFRWNRNDQNDNLNPDTGYTIFYTTDGTDPDSSSKVYKEPVYMENGSLKAVSVLNGTYGPICHERFGWNKEAWKILAVSSEEADKKADAVFDEDPSTYWVSQKGDTLGFISIDPGSVKTIAGFAYTPQSEHPGGMMEEGIFKVSDDGKTWKEVERFVFGNLMNDPTKRYHDFKHPVKARYVRIETTKIAADGDVVGIAELDLF